MSANARLTWIYDFARAPLGDAQIADLRDDLPALARNVGVGFTFRPPRALSAVEVRRIHMELHTGLLALQESRRVPRGTPKDLNERIRRRRGRGMSWPVGWRLPAHRLHLRLLPSPGPGEKTPVLALLETPNDFAAIVTAIAYFVSRQAPVWLECACGCGETFIAKGKRRFKPGHQNRHWQSRYRERERGAKLAAQAQ